MFEKTGEILSAMVRIPTVSGKGNEAEYKIEEYRACLYEAFSDLFSSCEKIPVGEALLLKIKGGTGEKKPVLFTGHMDVVPAQDSPKWEHAPFSGHMENGCIWGRGSQDMKGPQCALLSAVNELVKEGWTPDRDIWFYLSCDEEVGGATTDRAVDYLKEQGVLLDTVFDEGGTICENFMGLIKGKAALFGIAEKGSLEYRFTAKAAGGHAANPPKHSAIARLADFICEVEHNDIFKRELSGGNRMMLREMAAWSDEPKKSQMLAASEETGNGYPILHKVCPEAKTLLGATIAFTMIDGGTAFNVMPKEAHLTANVRVSSVETQAEVTEKLCRLAEKYDLVCELVSGVDASPESSTQCEAYLAMKQSVEKIYPGLPVVPFVLGGGTDSRHFIEITENVLRFSPMYAAPYQGSGVHGENESAFEYAVRDAARCYYELLKTHYGRKRI